MKICYFTCSSNFGGMEKIVIDTLNKISKNIDCSILIPKDCNYKNKFSSTVKLIEYKSSNKRYNPFLYIEIFNILKEYTIVHTHGGKATKIAYTLNKFSSFIHVATKHNIRKGKIFNKVKNVISVSSEVSKTITHKSKVLYFGVDGPLNTEVKRNNIFTIIAVGRLDKIKGFDNLIEEISKLNFEYHLKIIGEGKEKDKLLELINSKNLNNKISLLGFKEDIPMYLKDSHIQVISSLSEGLPLTLLEGIMNSSIIISTPVGGIVEVLDNDYLLKIKDFSKKIDRIYNNYEFYCNDFKLKHEHLKNKFNFDEYSKELIAYYRRIINV